MHCSFAITVLLCGGMLSACQTIDNAGLVYGSRTIGGIDVSGGPQGASGGANISFGYKREDLAFIPVAVCEMIDGKGCQKIEKLTGSDSFGGQSTSDSERLAVAEAIIKEGGDVTDQAKRVVTTLGKEVTPESISVTKSILSQENGSPPAEKAKQVQKVLGGPAKDAFSVFGSFEGRGVGSASSVEASAGNLFATGIAAQHLSKAVGAAAANRSFAYCVAEVSKAPRPADASPIDPLTVCLKPSTF